MSAMNDTGKLLFGTLDDAGWLSFEWKIFQKDLGDIEQTRAIEVFRRSFIKGLISDKNVRKPVEIVWSGDFKLKDLKLMYILYAK